jgi:hypothetical protein
MQIDDPKKQKWYDEMLAACKDFEPPLTDEEKANIRSAVDRGGTLILRCKFYNDEQPEILIERRYDINSEAK